MSEPRAARGSGRRGLRLFLTVALGVCAGIVVAVSVLAVTVAGFALSFDAIRAVGAAANIREDWAWLLPIAVDGAMIVGSVVAATLKWFDQPTRYPWVVVIGGTGISIGCNALHATASNGDLHLDPAVAAAVSAIPAISLALSMHLVMVLIIVLVRAVVASGGTDPAPPADLPLDGFPPEADQVPAILPPGGEAIPPPGGALALGPGGQASSASGRADGEAGQAAGDRGRDIGEEPGVRTTKERPSPRKHSDIDELVQLCRMQWPEKKPGRDAVRSAFSIGSDKADRIRELWTPRPDEELLAEIRVRWPGAAPGPGPMAEALHLSAPRADHLVALLDKLSSEDTAVDGSGVGGASP